MAEMDELSKYDARIAKADAGAIFAFGIAIGAFVPLLVIVLH
jgi:hypothetical protein